MVITADIQAQPESFRTMAEVAPPVWDHALRKLGDLSRFRRVVFTGMGSSYFASMAGAFALSAKGIPAAWELTSSLLYYGRERLQPGDLLVAISQSGESVEVVKLLQQIAGKGIPVLAVTNLAATAVGHLADATLELAVPPDHGVAIKTYGASILALLYLESALTGRPAAEWADKVRLAAAAVEKANANAGAWWALGRQLSGVPAAAVTGRGPSLSAAMAGALLFNEVAKVPAWGEDGGEFRHGIIEVAEPGFLATVVMAQGPTLELGNTLAAELAKTGARVLAVAPESAGAAVSAPGATVLTVPDLDESWMPLVQVVPFQWISSGWAEARGFEPGRFRNTPGVIRSER